MSTKFKRFWYSPSQSYYDELTADMSPQMKKGFANALAHGMLPLYRNEKGVWLTREDYILPIDYHKPDRPKTSLVDNEGQWHYYKEFEE